MKRGLRRKGFKNALVNTALQPIPQRYICRMKYAETFLLSSIASGYRFNLNSIFDPNRTGIGHQPYGHDTFVTLYNRYRVIACSYIITAYNASDAIRLCALPANEEVVVSNCSEAIENPRAKFITQFPGGNTNKLKGKISIANLMGRTKAQYMADDRFQATFGSSPVELAVLNIVHGNMLDAFPTGTNVHIQLTYVVECFDYKALGPS